MKRRLGFLDLDQNIDLPMQYFISSVLLVKSLYIFHQFHRYRDKTIVSIESMPVLCYCGLGHVFSAEFCTDCKLFLEEFKNTTH